MLADALGPETVLLREPGGTPLGERVRDMLMDPGLELGAGAELLLFGAARAALAEQLNAAVIGPCVPDLTLLLRIDPADAEARGQQRIAAGEVDGSDRFEAEGIEFQRTVAGAYDDLAERHPERIVVIDASGTP